MVVPAVTLLNENKPNQNGIDPNNPGNSVVISPKSSLLVNPNYGKLINRGSDTNYSIDVHYSTNLTHLELAPQSPLQNPVIERTKTLSPVQEISIIGRGTDPNVNIARSHISHYVREKEAPIISQTLTKNSIYNEILNAINILGPLYKAFIGKDKYFSNLSNLKALANNLLQDMNKLPTLDNIKALLKQVDNFQAVYNSFGNQLVSNKYIDEYWNYAFNLFNIFDNLYNFINNALQIKALLSTLKKELASKGVKNKELDILDKEVSQIADKLSDIKNELSSFGNDLYQISV